MKQVATHFWLACTITLGSLVTLSPTAAQIVPDNTLPVNSFVTSGCTVCVINGGTVRGTSLFHSFSEFSVPTNGEAFFNNGLQIQNILTRVTGNSVSNIDGLIGANGTANLFLLNPNGISFGVNATLNLGGSFVASTASSLVFADGTIFSAKPDTSTPPLLTISVPLGLQFGANPGRIVVQGNGQGTRRADSPVIDTDFGLRVQQDQTLALVGGDVSLEGATLKTAGGRIELGSVASQNLVSLAPTSKGWTLDYQGVSTLGDIQMSQQATVDASGLGGGDIQVWGRRVTLLGGSQIEASTLGEQPGGTLAVNASDSVEVMGISADGQFPSALFAYVYEGASGKGGDLTINTGILLVRDGAQVGAVTFSQGDGGNLTVKADQQVQLIGTTTDGHYSSGLFASNQPGASGNPGNLTINTDTLLVRDGAVVSTSTFGEGDGGNLTVNASDGVQVIGRSADGKIGSSLKVSNQPGASGKAGNLTINTGTLLVRDGAQVGAGTFGQGDGGNLTVNASKDVQLIGISVDGQASSGLFASANPGASGEGGNLTINTSTLLVRDGARVSVSHPTGVAGNITIQANSVRLNRGRLTAQTAKSSPEGGANITLKGLDLLRMDDESLISANALDQANGGNITIGSTLIVATPPTGRNGSDITANASEGNGGAVNVTTQGLFGIEFRPRLTPKNDITVSSEFGVNGTFQLITPGVDPSRGLANLPTQVVDASNQIAQTCAPGNVASQGNSFVVTGSGGLPPSPDEALSPDAVWVDWGTPPPAKAHQSSPAVSPKATTTTPASLVEAQGWEINDRGEVELTAATPTTTPHSSWHKPPTCPHS